MYRALKSAQVDMHDMLLKFADEVTQLNSNVEDKVPSESKSLMSLENSIMNMVNQQTMYFNHMTTTLRNLDLTMGAILNSLNNNKNTVNVTDKIPSIQPTSSNTDLKDICIAGPEDMSNIDHEDDIDADIQPGDIDEAFDNDLDAEQEEVVEDAEQEEVVEDAEQEEVVEDAEQEEVVEDAEQEEEIEEEVVEDAEQEVEEEQEEELEVEEWSYKGRLFFKDAENTVYLNDGGELGDPLGTYDPVKNIVKKLPSN